MKLSEGSRSSWVNQMFPTSIDKYLVRDRREDPEERRSCKDGLMAKIETMLSEAKEHLELLEVGGSKEGFSPRGFRGLTTLVTHRFQTYSLWNGERHISAVLNYTDCRNFLATATGS